VRVALTGQREGYFADYEGSAAELCETLRRGWLYCGQPRRSSGKRRGDDPSSLSPEKFIYCISNHDQVGNRAFGERLNHAVSPAAFRAASLLLCLVPSTPLLFMGQEWAATTPFRYFTNHSDELGPKITRGRRQEFRYFKEFQSPELLNAIPDPQDEGTFLESKLAWPEIAQPQHAQMLLLYREALHLRRTLPALQQRARGQWQIHLLENEVLALIYGDPRTGSCAVVVDLVGGKLKLPLESGPLGLPDGRSWETILSSNEERFGGDGRTTFDQPIVLLLRSK
jgi:maltooligosyltrehalose trehalohydrolase